MYEDLKSADLDLELVSLNEQHELRYWKETLGCRELTPRRAVAAIGNAVPDHC
ncbi:DUF3606 domain-containing protein [Variovorax ureilyticus]|uniref:DUF3606 domain-containing protein n=1 Tax=Variovorax ureilyticus TaxID=1836198 RepID=A0ABU8VQE9_9BURK